MAEIQRSDVAALRKATGAGMMDCKKALEENERRHRGGQGLAAQEGPRRRGKRAGRARRPGRDRRARRRQRRRDRRANCETDFVAKGDDFTGTRRARSPRLAVEQGNDELAELAVRRRDRRRARHAARGEARREDRARPRRRVRDRRRPARRLQARPERARHDRRARRARRRRRRRRQGPRGRARHRAAHRLGGAAVPSRATTFPTDVVDKERAVLEELTPQRGQARERARRRSSRAGSTASTRTTCLLEQAFVKDPKTDDRQARRGPRRRRRPSGASPASRSARTRRTSSRTERR